MLAQCSLLALPTLPSSKYRWKSPWKSRHWGKGWVAELGGIRGFPWSVLGSGPVKQHSRISL